MAPTGLAYDGNDLCWNEVAHAVGYLAWTVMFDFHTGWPAGDGRWCATLGAHPAGTVLSVSATDLIQGGHRQGPTATLVVPAPTPAPTPTATATATPLPALPSPFVATYGPVLLWGAIEHAAGYEVRWTRRATSR